MNMVNCNFCGKEKVLLSVETYASDPFCGLNRDQQVRYEVDTVACCPVCEDVTRCPYCGTYLISLFSRYHPYYCETLNDGVVHEMIG